MPLDAIAAAADDAAICCPLFPFISSSLSPCPPLPASLHLPATPALLSSSSLPFLPFTPRYPMPHTRHPTPDARRPPLAGHALHFLIPIIAHTHTRGSLLFPLCLLICPKGPDLGAPFRAFLRADTRAYLGPSGKRCIRPPPFSGSGSGLTFFFGRGGEERGEEGLLFTLLSFVFLLVLLNLRHVLISLFSYTINVFFS